MTPLSRRLTKAAGTKEIISSKTYDNNASGRVRFLLKGVFMPSEIWCAIIAGIVTLLTSIGTWHFSIRKDREKAKDELKAELIKYHEKNREEIQIIRQNDLRELRDDLTDMGANLQNKISLLEMSLNHAREDINTLSCRVEKHNNVIERVFRLEDADKLLDERIKVANHRIDDLEENAKKGV